MDEEEVKLGVKLLLHTRTVWDHEEDEPKLYGFQRELIFTHDGRLYHVGPEVRYEIDEPEECDE